MLELKLYDTIKNGTKNLVFLASYIHRTVRVSFNIKQLNIKF